MTRLGLLIQLEKNYMFAEITEDLYIQEQQQQKKRCAIGK